MPNSRLPRKGAGIPPPPPERNNGSFFARCCGCSTAEEIQHEIYVMCNCHEANLPYKYPSNFIKTSKYTILTFLPLNLFFQFNKVSNFYFLVNMIIALIPGVSPVNPATAIMPLIFVLGVAMAKEGYEDYVRHQADAKANSIVAHVVRDNPDGSGYTLQDIESKDVQVGDIIKVYLGEEFRADIILLSSILSEGQAFIDTCNLDGETNLKNKRSSEETWEFNSIESIVSHEIILKTNSPDPALLSWDGVLIIDGKEVSLGLDQFLYRSAVLRNTDYIWGIVAFAGVDTKMFRNLERKPPKLSNLDKKLNYLILGVLIFQLVILLSLATISLFWAQSHENHWYINYYNTEKSRGIMWISSLLTYFILMSYLIPISLFVTIELCKVAQARLMFWDVEMHEYMHGKWYGCIPNTSNLNEELSRIKFIFSDKTGTLTENIMNFKIGDILRSPVYADNYDISRGYFDDEETKEKAIRYFQALALCHTVQPFNDTENSNGLKYEGSSPDEVAFVVAATQHGFTLKERSTKSMTLDIRGEEVKFEIMATLEFTPDRKMMSIIVRDHRNGKITLFTKGADTFVIPQLAQGSHNSQFLPPTLESLRDMAETGLRTLLVCAKDLTQGEFDAWHNHFIEAGKVIENRSEAVDKVCLEMEDNMLLVGSTGIEDKLQDKVPETLKFFLDAGVIVWMLTGDKRETAVTIAATSSLVNPQCDHIDHIDIGDLHFLSDEAKERVGTQLDIIEEHCNSHIPVAFVVDGPALMVCMNLHFDQFLKLSLQVKSAVCCRLTPLQKSRVVRMFQQSSGLSALAIGDGANDVSMIQEGKVGVGIVGLEGAQAAMSADYAIPRFKHLKRLCCVHGRYALVRNAICILISFYKNIMLSMTQLYFAFFSGFSGQTLYDGWLLTLYNIAFTSIPPLVFGIFEKDIDEKLLMDNPELFLQVTNGAYFDIVTISKWFIEAILHSLIIFFFMLDFGQQNDLREKRMDTIMFGTCVMSCMIFLVIGKMSLHVRYWGWIHAIGLFACLLLYITVLMLYASIPSLFGDTSFFQTSYILMSDAKYWFFIILFAIGFLIPIDTSILFTQKLFKPTLRDEVEEQYSYGQSEN